ncbi:MAG: hypothetical protein IJL18_00720 [Synergistaceae bacterium]|nr:hypothetical protein [Synergistaceae bacterium]
MGWQIISIAALIIFVLVFLVVFWEIYKGMKTFLNDNIAEVLVVCGEVIDERIQVLDSSVSKKISSLQYENQTLRDGLNSRLDGISSIIREANNQTGDNFSYLREELIQKIDALASVKAAKGTDTAPIVSALREETAKLLRTMSQNMEDVSHKIEGLSATLVAIKSEGAGIDSEGIIKKLDLIVTALRDEMGTLLGTLAKNIEEVQKGTIKNFEDEIKKFNKAIDTAVKNIDRASQNQGNRLAQIAGIVQSTLNNGINDIRNNFNNLGVQLQAITQNAEAQINVNYENNIKAMFQIMADNLKAIMLQLKEFGAQGELSQHIQTLQDTMNGVTTKLEAIAATLDKTYQASQQQTPQTVQIIAAATPKKPKTSKKAAKVIKAAPAPAAAPTDENSNNAASAEPQQDNPEKGA